MKKSRWMLAIVGFAAVGVAGPAAAQDKTVYLGGSFGAVVYEESCSTLPRPCDNHDGGFRLFGGYQSGRNFALELGYADLGRVDAAVGFGTQTKSADLSGLLSFPVAGGLSAFGRVGAYRARTKSSAGNEVNTGFTYGAGLGYDFGRILGVRAEWQRWDNVGGAATGEDTINLFSVGALVRF